jgi:KDO2-lipid IV(A) lauroyltransferase
MKKLKKIKYLIEYIFVVFILKIANLIGLERSSKIFTFILKKLKNFISFTKVARNNIQLIYNLPRVKQEMLIDKIYDNFGRFIAELAILQNNDLKLIQNMVTLNGIEHVKHFQENQQPFLILTGHFANWEIALCVLTKIYPNAAVVHRKINNPYINNLISAQRKSFGISLIPKGPEGGKILIQHLKNKKTIAMLVDQKMNEGIKVPLMGHDAMTSDGMAKIALSFNYPIVPIQIVRINNTSQFQVNIYPALEIQVTDNKDQDIRNITLKINKILEDWINQNPEQWLWFHRRWNK